MGTVPRHTCEQQLRRLDVRCRSCIRAEFRWRPARLRCVLRRDGLADLSWRRISRPQNLMGIHVPSNRSSGHNISQRSRLRSRDGCSFRTGRKSKVVYSYQRWTALFAGRVGFRCLCVICRSCVERFLTYYRTVALAIQNCGRRGREDAGSLQ